MATTSAHVLETGLRHHRRKLTQPRQVILDVIAEADRHLCPSEVYERGKARYPRLGLTTVYRTLDLLVELGFVQRVHGEGACHSYVATVRPHGHHVLCTGCGRIEEFADCDLGPLVAALETRTGYRIDGHILELSGRCPACQGEGMLRAALCRSEHG